MLSDTPSDTPSATPSETVCDNEDYASEDCARGLSLGAPFPTNDLARWSMVRSQSGGRRRGGVKGMLNGRGEGGAHGWAHGWAHGRAEGCAQERGVQRVGSVVASRAGLIYYFNILVHSIHLFLTPVIYCNVV